VDQAEGAAAPATSTTDNDCHTSSLASVWLSFDSLSGSSVESFIVPKCCTVCVVSEVAKAMAVVPLAILVLCTTAQQQIFHKQKHGVLTSLFFHIHGVRLTWQCTCPIPFHGQQNNPHFHTT
jgi:hypothetical protein